MNGPDIEQKTERCIADLVEVFDLFDEEDDEVRKKAVDDILASSPHNPFAIYIKWQTIEDETAESRQMLADAVSSIEDVMDELLSSVPEAAQEAAQEDEAITPEDMLSVYTYMLGDLALSRYFADEKDAALAAAERYMRYDKDGDISGRIVYYPLLIERGEFERAIESADSDIVQTEPGAYCRAIAIFEMDGPTEEASDALIEAVSLFPDLPFYVIGLWELDEEQEGSEVDMLAAILSDVWTATEERLTFLAALTFAFGYITGRIDEDVDITEIEDGYKKLKCLDEMREARDTIAAMTASGRDQESIDEDALMLFMDIRDKGFFS